ncbi:MAG: DsbA family protein [Gammaproteobacteria bacterium]
MLKLIRNILARRTLIYKVRNRAMNMFSSFENFKAVREKSEIKRKEENRPHEVLYFHKVDDPYSHLTIQYVDKLISEYNILLKPVLVGEENSVAIHEPSLYEKYCLEDVHRISPFYNINFSSDSYPDKKLVKIANSILCSVKEKDFFEIGKKVSSALWENNENILDDLLKLHSSSDSVISEKILSGNKIRDESGYYFGSAFYYEKELYWGVDRINHLETRLNELGLKKIPSDELVCSLNTTAPEFLNSDKKLNLYYYPSLNSPYTFVSVKRIRELSEEYPINLITKPVLPMLMRMMVIPDFKAKYIISDAAREGRKYGYEMKSIYSPIGKPARLAYSLFPKIDEYGKGFEYIDALLKASFQDGINIGEKSFLKELVESLELDWTIIKKELNTKRWKKILNDNCNDMYSGNCWGVPSFKITNSDDSDPFYVWGQDRIWLLKEEIYKRCNN